jgi:hypothetical protein
MWVLSGSRGETWKSRSQELTFAILDVSGYGVEVSRVR